MPNTGSQASVPTAVVGSDGILEQTFAITPAKVLLLNNSAGTNGSINNGPGSDGPDNGIQVPPGPGKIYVPVEITVNLQFGGIAFATGTGDLQLNLQGGVGISVITTAQLKSGNSIFVRTVPSFTSADVGAGGGGNNKPFLFLLSTGVLYTAGNSGLVIKIRYRIEDVG